MKSTISSVLGCLCLESPMSLHVCVEHLYNDATLCGVGTIVHNTLHSINCTDVVLYWQVSVPVFSLCPPAACPLCMLSLAILPIIMIVIGKSVSHVISGLHHCILLFLYTQTLLTVTNSEGSCTSIASIMLLLLGVVKKIWWSHEKKMACMFRYSSFRSW